MSELNHHTLNLLAQSHLYARTHAKGFTKKRYETSYANLFKAHLSGVEAALDWVEGVRISA